MLRQVFDITGQASATRAEAAIEHLPRWRAGAGVQGHCRGQRLTLYLDEPRRLLLLPVLKARLDGTRSQMRAVGTIQPVWLLLAVLAIPVAFVVGAVTATGGGRWVLLALGVLAGASLGLAIRDDLRQYPGRAAELEHQLRKLLDGQAPRR